VADGYLTGNRFSWIKLRTRTLGEQQKGVPSRRLGDSRERVLRCATLPQRRGRLRRQVTTP